MDGISANLLLPADVRQLYDDDIILNGRVCIHSGRPLKFGTASSYDQATYDRVEKIFADQPGQTTQLVNQFHNKYLLFNIV